MAVVKGIRITRAGLYLLLFSICLSISGMQAGLALAIIGLLWELIIDRTPLRKTPFDLPVFLFLLVTLLSALLSIDPAKGMREFAGSWTVAGLYLMAYHADDSNFLGKALKVMFLPALAVGTYGIFQHVTGVDIIRPGTPLEQLTFAGRSVYFPRGAFSHYQTFSNVFFLLFSLSAALALHAEGKKDRIFWTASFLLMAAVMILSYTRGIWLSSLVAFLFVAVFSFSLRRTAALLAGALVVAVIVFFTSGDRLAARARTIFTVSQNVERLMLWETTWNMIRDYPRLGVGVGNYQRTQDQYERPAVGRQMTRSHSHNILLQVTVERGIFGLFIFLWIWYLIVKKGFYGLWALREQGGRAFGILLGSLAGLTGFFVDGFFQNNFGDTEVVILFWLLVGMITAVVRKGSLAHVSQD